VKISANILYILPVYKKNGRQNFQNHDLHIHSVKLGNPSHTKERMVFADVSEQSAVETEL